MEYGIWNVEYGIWNMDYGLWTMEWDEIRQILSPVTGS